MNLIISYRKFKVKSGKPICLSVKGYEIFTDNLILKNITGHVTFQPNKRDRHGSTAPLIIPIIDDTVISIDESNINSIKDPIKRKRAREKLRYRANNPEQKRVRNDIVL